MIDINEIIKNRESVEKALLKRVDGIDFSSVIEMHEKRKILKSSIDRLREKRKLSSKEIAQVISQGGDPEEMKLGVNEISKNIEEMEEQYREYNSEVEKFLSYLPNIPEDEVPSGGKENNEPLEYFHSKPEFDFKPKDHVELATTLNLVDYERGVKIGGHGKWVYWGDGALLEWGLINYFISQHRKLGYKFVLPPHLLKVEAGYVAGQFPKFKDDVFYVTSRADKDDDYTHFLLPTSETALANLYSNEVIPESELPIVLFGYSPCYRRESGSYRTNERGTIRGNQFNKVEIFSLTTPEDSERSFQQIVQDAKGLLDGLGLHYRLTRLAAKDCSDSMAKTYDLEVWIPSIGEYKEASSISTAHTFQAIRGGIRYKSKSSKKNMHVHTQNGSGLATSRVLPAILEQCQLADGSIKVPEVLREYVGKDYLTLPE